MEHELHVRVLRDRCPYCHDTIEATPAREACAICAAWHHSACWSELGGCSACGFKRARAGPRARASCSPLHLRVGRGLRARGQAPLRPRCSEHTRGAYMARSAWFGAFALLFALASVPPFQTPGARSAGVIFLGLAALFALIGVIFCRRGYAIDPEAESGAEVFSPRLASERAIPTK